MAQAPTYTDLSRGLIVLAEQRRQAVVRRATAIHPIKRVIYGLVGFGLLAVVVGLVNAGHSPGMATMPRFGAYLGATLVAPGFLYFTIRALRGR